MNREEYGAYLTRIGKGCERDLERIGIHCGNVVKYQVLDHIKEWGLCIPVGNERYFIDLSYALIVGGSLRGIKTVVYHELLHTLPGCIRHNQKWKTNAENVTKKLGYQIKIHDDWFDLGFDSNKLYDLLKYRYMVKCTACGKEIFKKKTCDLIKRPYRYKCGICGGKFQVSHIKGE